MINKIKLINGDAFNADDINVPINETIDLVEQNKADVINAIQKSSEALNVANQAHVDANTAVNNANEAKQNAISAKQLAETVTKRANAGEFDGTNGMYGVVFWGIDAPCEMSTMEWRTI